MSKGGREGTQVVQPHNERSTYSHRQLRLQNPARCHAIILYDIRRHDVLCILCKPTPTQ